MPEAIPFSQPARRVDRRRILNDTTIRGLKPPATGRVDYFDDATPGLSLRVTAQNVRTWTVFYRDQHGRQKRLTLGRYPVVKLVDARELAREAQRRVAHGGDPVVEKRRGARRTHIRSAGGAVHRRARQAKQEELGGR